MGQIKLHHGPNKDVQEQQDVDIYMGKQQQVHGGKSGWDEQNRNHGSPVGKA